MLLVNSNLEEERNTVWYLPSAGLAARQLEPGGGEKYSLISALSWPCCSLTRTCRSREIRGFFECLLACLLACLLDWLIDWLIDWRFIALSKEVRIQSGISHQLETRPAMLLVNSNMEEEIDQHTNNRMKGLRTLSITVHYIKTLKTSLAQPYSICKRTRQHADTKIVMHTLSHNLKFKM